MKKVDETSADGRLVDDFLRRALRVADPRNPLEIVAALRKRYATDAIRLDEESAGLPIPLSSSLLPPEAPVGGSDTPGDRELARVSQYLDADLTTLVSAPATREWIPEMAGWQAALRRELGDGADAAQFAQDAAQRERAFLSVRRLCDYARIARFVGCLNTEAFAPFRRLATTLDDGASAIRILMGEALYGAGLSEGGLLVQVPVTDARQRRDALIAALGALAGTSVDDPSWGDGAASYGALLRALDRASASELKVYLRESMLAQSLDDLLSGLSRSDPAALRGLAATAPVELSRLRRLLRLLGEAGLPASSALSGFVQTLRLFLEAFDDTRAGSRLVDLAVPLPMAAQQTNGADAEGRRILRNLVSWRADLARESECFLGGCGCGDGATLDEQVQIDTCLALTDHAIDLVSQGDGRPPTWTAEERRAAATMTAVKNLGTLVLELAPVVNQLQNTGIFGVLPDPNAQPAPQGLEAILRSRAELFRSVLKEHVGYNLAWEALVVTLVPRCQKFFT